MPNGAINNLTAPDQVTPQSTLDLGLLVDHFNINVANQAIYWAYKDYTEGQAPGTATWNQFVYLPPGFMPVYRDRMTGIQFYAAVPFASLPAGDIQAQVTVEAVI